MHVPDKETQYIKYVSAKGIATAVRCDLFTTADNDDHAKAAKHADADDYGDGYGECMVYESDKLRFSGTRRSCLT